MGQEDSFYTQSTPIQDVISDTDFKGYGQLIFPLNSNYYGGQTLRDLRLAWYSNIDPNKTVEIVNFFKNRARNNLPVFYDIYTEQEKSKDPEKRNTGLFFFPGYPDEKVAICNAGGGFAYVGAIHDSFPHALELSKLGYNAFALIYRPDLQKACEDLARAIQFLFEHVQKLHIDMDDYSLWGGSAGARMAAYLGRYGTQAFKAQKCPKPVAVIIQYTGLHDYSQDDCPTYACVGSSDDIANWRVMQSRLQVLSALGIPTKFQVYTGLHHGFGLGTSTIAQGWIQEAIAFWKSQMKEQAKNNAL